ncbi:hypothetical protein WDU99_12975 [Microbacterium sp. Mu-80]|uniref:DUF7927 domain-containing protein n=1 Tax=Microbacterium bandirmense TaxID=3122050 RepID=A0ABU8LDI1_9MICO
MRRSTAMAAVLSLVSAALVVFGAVTPAAAATVGGTVSLGGNTYFAYVDDGEQLDVRFEKWNNLGSEGSGVRFRVTDPAGDVHMDCMSELGAAAGDLCEASALTGPAGVWIIEEIPVENVTDGYLRSASNSRFLWDVMVSDAEGEIPGRVWTDLYMAYDGPGSSGGYDVALWAVSEFGAVYSIALNGFIGGGWSLDSNAFGIVDGETCTPLYHSTPTPGNVPRYNQAGAECGDPYWLFFDAPADDLPTSAPSARGELWVLPEVATPTVSDLAFARDAAGSWAGSFSYGLAGFTGAYELRIDVDGDGAFDGATDRVVPLGGSAGAHTYTWDGRDGQGALIDPCTALTAEVAIDRADELHMVLADVEAVREGLRVEQLRGNSPGSTSLHWDDSTISTDGKTSVTSPLDASAGVDSSDGVHRWESTGSNPWGNQVASDHWAYSDVDASASIPLAAGCLEVDKSSDATADTRAGDTVTYTVMATNTGSADYTVDNPAVVMDDLAGVLDDGVFADDARADRDGTLSYQEPLLAWNGALAVDESVTLTYSVVLGSGGDRDVRNIAWAPKDPQDAQTPVCEGAGGTDPVTGESCAEVRYPLPALTVAKTADRTDLPAVGERVEYQVVVANPGPGDYTDTAPATMTDDLSDVLDDATIVSGSLAATVGDVGIDGAQLSWTGALAAEESATITYTVEYTGEGDRVLTNRACVPADQVIGEACDTVLVPGSGLDQWKSVSSSDSPVVAGSVLTYTLHFVNDGAAAALVDAVDDLRHVTDDAEVSTEPAAESGLQAVRTGDAIAITGSVPAGETRTVTYQVTVLPDSERGDDVAANFLLEQGQVPPAQPVCEPTDDQRPDCTTTPIAAVTYAKAVVASSDPVEEGTTLTYTVTVRSTGAATTQVDREDVLTGVLDDAELTSAPASDTASVTVAAVEDGRFRIGGELAAGETAHITYEVMVLPQDERGDDSADNFLVTPGADAPDDCAPGSDQCTSTPLPRIAAVKSSDPASGEDVQAGQEVTYTLTFTNSGGAAGTVDHSDRLAGVLDDADIDAEVVVSDAALTAVRDGEDLLVGGILAAGQSVTVSYTATVRADGDRGDNRLANVLARADVIDTDCDDAGVSCTVHPIGELDDWKTVDPASGSSVQPGQVVTYTLHFESTGTAPVSVATEDVLAGVLDDAAITSAPRASDEALSVSAVEDGRFSVTGELEPGAHVTVTYAVTVNADGQRGDDRLANAIVPAGEDPAETCEPVDQERPDCTVNHVSHVVASKSADPESGTHVGEGRSVTYTLTFRNVSANPEAAPAAIDFTDHLRGVLDDADLIEGPATKGAGATAERSAEGIRVTGAIAPATTVIVTYTVKVRSWDEQGDHELGNVVAVTGEQPLCAPDSDLCTIHPLDENPPLAATGGEVPAAVWGAGILLLLSGAAALLIRARRMRLSAQD